MYIFSDRYTKALITIVYKTGNARRMLAVMGLRSAVKDHEVGIGGLMRPWVWAVAALSKK